MQPSLIELNLNLKYDQITLPYRLWNQENDTVVVSITPVNISEFTNFTTINVTLMAHTNRTNGYLTIPIVFKKTTGNTTIEGGISIKPIPPTTGMIKLIPEIFARIKIVQTDTNTSEPPYSFPKTNETNTTNTSTSSGSGSSTGNTQNFFLQHKQAIGIVVIVLLLLIGLLLAYKYIFQSF